MSPTKRPSAVEGMRRGVGSSHAEAGQATPPNPYLEADLRNAPPARPPKPVRVTLNIPPELYRELRKWTNSAADEIGAPQVSQQDAMRAMLTAAVLDQSIGLVVLDLLRRNGSP